MRFFSVLRLTAEGVKRKKGITFEKKIVNIKILNTIIYLYLFISIYLN